MADTDSLGGKLSNGNSGAGIEETIVVILLIFLIIFLFHQMYRYEKQVTFIIVSIRGYR